MCENVYAHVLLTIVIKLLFYEINICTLFITGHMIDYISFNENYTIKLLQLSWRNLFQFFKSNLIRVSWIQYSTWHYNFMWLSWVRLNRSGKHWGLACLLSLTEEITIKLERNETFLIADEYQHKLIQKIFYFVYDISKK